MTTRFDYVRYLRAKKTVDDRALNKDVLGRLALALEGRAPLRVLELGAGIGTMPLRLLDAHVLGRAEYDLVDGDAHLLDAARSLLEPLAAGRGLGVRFLQWEIHEFARSMPRAHYDLVIASAVLDLLDVPAILPPLLDSLTPGGLCWFCINFDGETAFVPEHPADAALLSVYHRSMDERAKLGRGAGTSKSGRRLLQQLPAAGARILAAGASDWVVHPIDGGYPADEAYFLRCILETVREELERHADVSRAALSEWVALRQAQIDRAELAHIAHQLDVLGQRP